MARGGAVALGVAMPGSVNRQAAAQAIEAFLRALGRDLERDPELSGTGMRVAEAWSNELLSGYDTDVDALVQGAVMAGRSELVVVRDVPLSTTCPHHLILSSGTATVGFAPRERLIGVGTVTRLVAALSRRLALQEQIGNDIVETLVAHLAPRWAACRIVLSHGCMLARGERAHGARVETVAVRGDADVATLGPLLGVGT